MSKERCIKEQIDVVERRSIEGLNSEKYNWDRPWKQTLRSTYHPDAQSLQKLTEKMHNATVHEIDRVLRPELTYEMVGDLKAQAVPKTRKLNEVFLMQNMSPKSNSNPQVLGKDEMNEMLFKRKCGFSKVHEDEERGIRKQIRANFRKKQLVQRPVTADRQKQIHKSYKKHLEISASNYEKLQQGYSKSLENSSFVKAQESTNTCLAWMYSDKSMRHVAQGPIFGQSKSAKGI